MNREIALKDFKGTWIGNNSAGEEYRLIINDKYEAKLSNGLASIPGNRIYEGPLTFSIKNDYEYFLNIGKKPLDCAIKVRQNVDNFSKNIIEEIKFTDPIIDTKPIVLKNIEVQ